MTHGLSIGDKSENLNLRMCPPSFFSVRLSALCGWRFLPSSMLPSAQVSRPIQNDPLPKVDRKKFFITVGNLGFVDLTLDSALASEL
jgi:hypothetical protein